MGNLAQKASTGKLRNCEGANHDKVEGTKSSKGLKWKREEVGKREDPMRGGWKLLGNEQKERDKDKMKEGNKLKEKQKAN